jgi:ABC-type bacteriocin/lantibiotic exporter with double-glycine peptidase domain
MSNMDEFLNKVFKYLPRIFITKPFKLETNYYTSLKDVIIKNWKLISFVQTLFVVESLVVSSFPILIEYVLRNNNRWYILSGLAMVMLFKPLVALVQEYFNILMQSKIKYSLSLQANKFFLEVDPINHGTRSSGEVISKVNRLVNSIENFSDNFNYQLLPNLTPPIVTIIYFMSFGIHIGITTMMVLLIIAGLSIFLNGVTMNHANKIYNLDEDNLSKNIVQNLAQIFLIRASFATDIQFLETTRLHEKMKQTFSTYYILMTILYGAIRILAVGGALLIIYLLLIQGLNQITLISSIILLVSSLVAVNSLGRNTSRIYKDYLNIKEYFEYTQKFGVSTFPTLQ